MTTSDETKARLEYLRGQIDAECISYGEIAELQGLAAEIDPSDVQLLEWAGVPEFPEQEQWVVLLTAGYDVPEAFGPFGSEDECYRAAALLSQEPNDWTPLKLRSLSDDPDWNGPDEVDTAFVAKIAKQDADDGVTPECEHGYSEGCPDCDVASHFPAVLGEGLSGRLTEVVEDDDG